MGRALSLAAADDGTGVDLHQRAALLLAAVDQRYTTKRRALVDALAGRGQPLTLQEILGSAPGIPQSSAYRNLAVLAEAGVVRRVQGVDENGRFELAENLSGDHHHHLVCTGCGLVADVAASTKLERALAEAARAAADNGDFLVVEHRFDLVGLCAGCRPD